MAQPKNGLRDLIQHIITSKTFLKN
jgi:hypothetical protein